MGFFSGLSKMINEGVGNTGALEKKKECDEECDEESEALDRRFKKLKTLISKKSINDPLLQDLISEGKELIECWDKRDYDSCLEGLKRVSSHFDELEGKTKYHVNTGIMPKSIDNPSSMDTFKLFKLKEEINLHKSLLEEYKKFNPLKGIEPEECMHKPICPNLDKFNYSLSGLKTVDEILKDIKKVPIMPISPSSSYNSGISSSYDPIPKHIIQHEMEHNARELKKMTVPSSNLPEYFGKSNTYIRDQVGGAMLKADFAKLMSTIGTEGWSLPMPKDRPYG